MPSPIGIPAMPEDVRLSEIDVSTFGGEKRDRFGEVVRLSLATAPSSPYGAIIGQFVGEIIPQNPDAGAYYRWAQQAGLGNRPGQAGWLAGLRLRQDISSRWSRVTAPIAEMASSLPPSTIDPASLLCAYRREGCSLTDAQLLALLPEVERLDDGDVEEFAQRVAAVDRAAKIARGRETAESFGIEEPTDDEALQVAEMLEKLDACERSVKIPEADLLDEDFSIEPLLKKIAAETEAAAAEVDDALYRIIEDRFLNGRPGQAEPVGVLTDAICSAFATVGDIFRRALESSDDFDKAAHREKYRASRKGWRPHKAINLKQWVQA